MSIRKATLWLFLFTIHQTASAEGFLKKNDLQGQWSLKNAACSGGKRLDEIKNANLNYDGKHLALIVKDEKSNKDENVIDTDLFVVQEDLLTFPKAQNGFATVKLQKKSKTVLALKFPMVGLPGDCPENELAVWTFSKSK